jgi:hypothetical protein
VNARSDDAATELVYNHRNPMESPISTAVSIVFIAASVPYILAWKFIFQLIQDVNLRSTENNVSVWEWHKGWKVHRQFFPNEPGPWTHCHLHFLGGWLNAGGLLHCGSKHDFVSANSALNERQSSMSDGSDVTACPWRITELGQN